MSVAPQVHSTPPLIAHADWLGGSIAQLTELLRGPLRGVFGGVHVGLQADGNDVELLERTGVACATLQIDFRDLSHRPTSAIDGRQATVDDVMAIPEIASAWDATAGSAS